MSELQALFVLCDRMISASVTLPLEMLATAEALHQSQRNTPKLSISTVGINRHPVKTLSGIDMKPELTIKNTKKASIIVIPALWRNPKLALKRHTELIPWLTEMSDRGAIIVAVGTGCCFLAEAGLLDQRPATTHWHYFDQFEKNYPSVQLKRQYFITQAKNIFCAASVNAVADLMIHFLRQFYGERVANHVQRNFFHEIRRPYEIGGIYDEQTLHHPDEDIVQAQIWLNDHYHENINLSELASTLSMSTRSFNRRFKEATGRTPLEYLQNTRISNATDLLKSTNLSISDIAFRVGYSDKSYFTQIFRKKQNVTPSEYRATVRAKLFSV